MAKPLNRHTTLVRNAVKEWIQRNCGVSFTVPILTFELKTLLGDLDIDLGKAVSNELARRELSGLIICVDTEVVGLGRPPKVYRQKWVV